MNLVAHHTDCTFIRVSGSELVQKYIGEGSRMVRELFVMAREAAPTIIFMDEIDSIGSQRQEGSQGGDRCELHFMSINRIIMSCMYVSNVVLFHNLVPKEFLFCAFV